MKGIKITVVALLVVVTTMCNGFTVHASDFDEADSTISASSDVDAALIGAQLISEKEYVENGRRISEKIYEQEDGTIIIDTLNVGANLLRSSNGSDTATRTRTISGWGSITITATFDWYTEGAFSYVRCSSMSASRSLVSGVVVSTWTTSRTSNYVAIGTANAQVEYYFYNSAVPFQYQQGTFKITCTDDGSISDNG